MGHTLSLKRLFDLFVASSSLIILSPLIVLIAVMVRLDSQGPIFFQQQRLGEAGRIFKIVKFRSMVQDAENIGTGIVSLDNDQRITRTGKFLRSTSLDELPQLWNVIRGDMSLVGPRPPVVYHPYDGYDNYPAWTRRRFEVKPGITGLSQLTVRNNATWEERIKIDIQYVNTYRLSSDIIILIKTFIQIFNSELFLIQAKGEKR